MKKMLLIILAIIVIYVVLQTLYSFYYLNIGGALAKTIYARTVKLGDSKNPQFSIFINGDSVGAGVEATSFENSVAGRLGNYLAEKYYVDFENVSVSGFKMHDVLTSKAPTETKDLIVLIVSSNNLFRFTDLDDFKIDTRAVLAKYSPLAKKLVIVGPGRIIDSQAVPVVFLPFYHLQGPKYAQVIDEAAKKYTNVVHVNPLLHKLDTKIYGKNTSAADKFHPNDEGQRYWFDLIKESL